MKNRRRIFEFNDQAWLPNNLRFAFNRLLLADVRYGALYDACIPLLATHIRLGEYKRIHDMAAGSGAIWLQLKQKLRDELCELPVLLSDLHPPKSSELIDLLATQDIDYHSQPLNIKRFTPQETDFLTLFAGLHHFNPEEIHTLFGKVAESGCGLAVIEFTHRDMFSWQHASETLRSMRQRYDTIPEFRLKRRFIDKVIPLVPLLYTWDAMASHARSYTLEEMRALTQSIEVPGYSWRVDQLRDPVSGTRLNYVIGCRV